MATRKNNMVKTPLQQAIKVALCSTGLLLGSSISLVAIAAESAQHSARQLFTVPAGDLGKNITEVAAQHHIALSFNPELTQGLKNPAIHGEFTPLELIDRLLSGSNLLMVANKDGTYSLLDQQDYTLPGVAVSADKVAQSKSTAYSGGQIEAGGRLGTFGEQNSANVPFSVISYTDKTIDNQQAESIAEVLDNDASVQSGYGYGNYSETFMVRGFALDSDAISYNGLYGILPRQVVSTNAIESVQLLKGSSAFLNGVTPGGSGIGGAINLQPKRADTDLNKISLDTSAKGQTGINLDVARRFGSKKQWGVRSNVLYRDGDSAIDNESREETAISIGADYRSDTLRVSTDIGYQNLKIDSGRSVVHNSSYFDVSAPDATTNYSPSWAKSRLKTLYGMINADYDLNDDWTLHAGLGVNKNKEYGDYSSPTLSNADGDATLTRLSVPYESNTFASTLGLVGHVNTGDVTHRINLAYSGFLNKAYNAYTYGSASDNSTNIYHPNDTEYPTASSLAAGNMDNPHIRSKTNAQGVSLADTLGFLDDTLLITVGLRRQNITVNNYDYDGIESSYYDDAATSPIYGIVYKPIENVSLYANHVEALQQGDQVTDTSAANYGSVLAPYVSKQNEIGVKYENGTLGAELALFEITKPEAYTLNGDYGLHGEQRNRGVEVSLYGEPMAGVRLHTSATVLDPELRNAEDSGNNGNDAAGVAKYRLVVGGEYDLPFFAGATLGGKVIRSGPQYLDAANTSELDSWTRIDLSARYQTQISEHEVTWRLNITNLMNKGYWESASSSGYLTQGSPRGIKLSMSSTF
ncbi:TonB-dependent receptor [Marinomonas pollencensis]|uniref:Iron complex outermembrane receptor protein n=1 Tax=Marinomonas pollencensis TaxID=491954 RepID=A0A3E0DJ28_9GAMM|nr:TonB-dependent receptor [Marinomonas pollencensis]REG82619.1 iron complex outermembrane receptor protein [Marinomonas pollencensis]